MNSENDAVEINENIISDDNEILENGSLATCENDNMVSENISDSSTNDIPDCGASKLHLAKVEPCETKRNHKSDYKNHTKEYQLDANLNCNIEQRNKYTDDVYEIDSEAYDQPIDYSRKYSETKSTPDVSINSKIIRKPEIPKQTTQYGDYQETDLDQVTDYSLRYAENNLKLAWDIEEEEYDPPESNFVLEDTVKCYYTEGTPYETPCNISTATSMSDLRISNQEDEKNHKSYVKKKTIKVISNVGNVGSSDNEIVTKNPTNLEPELNYDSSPEKPVDYSKRDKNEFFSKLSLSSSVEKLNNVENESVEESLNTTAEKNEIIEETYTPEKDNGRNKQRNGDNDEKIAFASMANSALETPLMFSRSSSLSSLSSVELPDVADDWSSVISDFSRLNSGYVSPSDLPDSPTEIIQTNRFFPVVEQSKVATNYDDHSIFQDQVKFFGEESTPAEFSTSTSLSALTIIDDNGLNIDTNGDNNNEKHEQKENSQSTSNKDVIKTSGDDVQIYYTEDTPAILSKVGSYSDLSEISIRNDSNLDEGSQDKRESSWSDDSSILSGESTHLLEECIKSGMNKPPQLVTNSLESYPARILPGFTSVNNCVPNLHNYWSSAKDEIGSYDVEDSPCNFSIASGLSGLTVNSTDKADLADLKTSRGEEAINGRHQHEEEELHQPFIPNGLEDFHSFSDEDVRASAKLSTANSLSSISISSNEDDSILLNLAISEGISKAGSKCENLDWDKNSIHTTVRQIPSFSNLQSRATGRGSSSSSVESLEEGEQELFEQCIKSGLPKEKTEQKLTKKLKPRSLEQLFGSQSVEHNIRSQPRSHSEQRSPSSQLDKSDPIRRSTRSTERQKQIKLRQNYTLHKYSHVSQLPTYNSRVSQKSQKQESPQAKYNKDEIDQQILEECINSGMPKRKSLVDTQNGGHRFNREMDRF